MRWACGLLLGVGTLAAGHRWDRRAERRTFKTVGPPGRYASGRNGRLHIVEQGTGKPTIVLESALGGWSIEWSELLRVLDPDLHVVAYDRRGLGWSDPGASETVDDLVEDLRACLGHAGIEPPFVLVGASFGGILARAFCARYPAETTGLVLLDSSHEAMLDRLEGERRKARLMTTALAVVLPLANLGVFRAARLAVVNAAVLSEEDRRLARAVGVRRSAYKALLQDARSLLSNRGDIPISRVPAAVLVSSENANRLPGGDRWRALQEEIAEAVGTTSEIVESGHLIAQHHPALVAQRIKDLVTATA